MTREEIIQLALDIGLRAARTYKHRGSLEAMTEPERKELEQLLEFANQIIHRDEALLRQALAALEQARRELRVVWTTTTPEIIDAIDVLRERLAETANDLTRCPNCGGPADNGHDREVPPNPYWCSKCTES